MGPYAGVDYNLTLCPLQSQLQHIYHGQWATLCQSRTSEVDFIPQSGTLELAYGDITKMPILRGGISKQQ
jgi:hypothetical protein